MGISVKDRKPKGNSGSVNYSNWSENSLEWLKGRFE